MDVIFLEGFALGRYTRLPGTQEDPDEAIAQLYANRAARLKARMRVSMTTSATSQSVRIVC